MAAAIVSMVVSVAIIVALAGKAVTFLSNVELGQLWADGWRPRSGEFDVLTIFIGTIEVSVIAMMIATPLGLGAAMYLSEYANPKTRRKLKPILETLAVERGAAAVLRPAGHQPGARATAVLVGRHVQRHGGRHRGRDPHDPTDRIGRRGRDVRGAERARTGGLRDRRAPPDRDDQGRVPGRRLGHRGRPDPRFLAGRRGDDGRGDRRGATGSATRHLNPLEPGQTMTGAISSLAIGSDQVKSTTGLNPFDSLFFVGLLLFVMTLALNVVSERYVRKVRKDF